MVLLEIEPEKQKTRVDFAVTEQLLGIPVGRRHARSSSGAAGSSIREGGREVPIRRIYNRVIFDEVERKGLDLSHIFRRDLGRHLGRASRTGTSRSASSRCPSSAAATARRTWFVSDLAELPADLENYVLKPLFSFAGLGVELGPSPERLRSLPDPENFILQRRVDYAPCRRDARRARPRPRCA